MRNHPNSTEGPVKFDRGNTWVAFSDLCGFKALMKDKEKASGALDYLYNTVFSMKLSNSDYDDLSALAVSDKVISYLHSNTDNLSIILKFLKTLHEKMIERDFLLKSAVSYGEFEYQNRIIIYGVGKAFLMGNAYVNSYLKSKMLEPGRIIILSSKNNHDFAGEFTEIIKPIRDGQEFFWKVNRSQDIESFKRARKAAMKQKYQPLIDLYKR